MRTPVTAISVQRGRYLADAKTRDGRLDHHFTRELHAFAPKRQIKNGAPLEPAQAAMEITDWRGKEPATYERERGIAEVTVKQWHGAGTNSASEAIAHDELFSECKALAKASRLAKS